MTDPVENVALPHAVALSWGIAERPERGPKRELSIERIVESAIEIADVEGLAAVSMSRVAASLGFTTMSLYRYVTSKDDLLLLMQDQALAMPIPPDTRLAAAAGEKNIGPLDWRTELREWVLLTQQNYRGHPWFMEIPPSGVLLTPNNLKLIDWGLRGLAATGLSGAEKLAIVELLGGYARSGGFSSDLSNAAFGAALRELVSEERFPHLRAVILDDAAPVQGPEFGLERILDGIERYLAQSPVERTQTGASVSNAAMDDRLDFYRKDPAVREAAAKRREAEQRLREAQKREREQIQKARERALKQSARA